MVDDTTGNGRFAQPFKTVKNAMQQISTSARRILLLGPYSEEVPNWTAADGALGGGIARAIKIIAARPDFRFRNPTVGVNSMTWGAIGNGYVAVPSPDSLRLHAMFIRNESGDRQIIPYYPTQSAAEAALYGWTQNVSNGSIYVRMDGIDIEARKADIELIFAGPVARINGALLFIKNVDFYGLTDFQVKYGQVGSVWNRPVLFMENCKIRYGSGSYNSGLLGYGLKSLGGLLVTKKCEWSHNTLDGMNADPDAEGGTGQEPWHVSIDDRYVSNLQGSKAFVEFITANPTARNIQGSSYHQGLVVRVNPYCADNYGQNIADTQTTPTSGTWLIGAMCDSVRADLQVDTSTVPSPVPRNSAIRTRYPNIQLDSPNSWLDTCRAGGRKSTFGLVASNAKVFNSAFDGASGGVQGPTTSYDPFRL